MIEGIVFNELAGHRAVELPGVGVLRVVRRSAHVEGGAMVPPHNMVVFSVQGAEGTPSVINLGAAEAVYDKWLASAMVDGELVIGGVGRLLMGEFTPSAELDNVLNPGAFAREATPGAAPASEVVHVASLGEHVGLGESMPSAEDDNVPDLAAASSTFDKSSLLIPNFPLEENAKPIKEPMDNRTSYDTSAGGYDTANPRRRGATGVLMAFVILLLLALAAVLIVCIMPMKREVEQLRNQSRDLQEQLRTQTAAPVATPAPAVEPVPEAAAKPEVEKYHLIVGSFTQSEQAQKSAERFRKNYPNLTVKVFDNGSGRTYVSVFQSESRKAAYSRFYKIAEQTGNWDDMWVWERP